MTSELLRFLLLAGQDVPNNGPITQSPTVPYCSLNNGTNSAAGADATVLMSRKSGAYVFARLELNNAELPPCECPHTA